MAEMTRYEMCHDINSSLDESHTKKARARMVREARAALGFPFQIVGTTESGEPRAWLIQTPTDARVFVASASSRIDWSVR